MIKKENKRETRLMLNIEKYKDDIMNAKQEDIYCSVHNILLQLSHIPCTGNCRECKKNVMEWLLEEYSEPILDDAEKEYLSAVIKPFRNRVKYITKFIGVFDNEFIEIDHVMDNEAELYYIELPLFKKGTMYKGMKLGRNYTLEELEL